MVQELDAQAKKKGKGRANWLILLFFIIFLVWMVYNSLQYQKNDSMSSNMNGMSSETSEETPSEMPEDMSGMNHP
jgi:hypothetical protein